MQAKTYLLSSSKPESPPKPPAPKKPAPLSSHPLPADCPLTLLIDNREVRCQKDRNYFLSRLQDDYGISARLENLAVGDFLWVAEH